MNNFLIYESNMSFLDAAEIILKEFDKPMTGPEIWSEIVNRNLVSWTGKSPETSSLPQMMTRNPNRFERLPGSPARYQINKSVSINSKEDDIKRLYDEKLNDWKQKQSKLNKNTTPGQETRKRLWNEACSELGIDKSNKIDEYQIDLNQYSKLFEQIKTASTEVFKCINDTNFLTQKLNEVDKEFFREYLEFRRVGPVNDLRAEVAERLIKNDLTTEELVEIINRHRSEKPQQFRSWTNPYKILHPFINQKYKDFDREMQNLANEISEEFDGLRFKFNNFNGSQQQGSDKWWIAFYNKTLANQSVSLQLFINFVNGVSEYGIYRYNGDEYLVGPETYTGMEKFSEFLYENIDTILDDEDESGQIQPQDPDEFSDLENIKIFRKFPQPFDVESELKKAQAQSEDDLKSYSFPFKSDKEVKSFIDFKAMEPNEKFGENPFKQAICVLGKSGAGKSYTIDEILEKDSKQRPHKYEFIIPSASTTGLLSQFSPSAKDGRGGYIPSRLGKLIELAYKNPKTLYTAVFDECHKSNVIEMINDELLQAISTGRNKNRFISLDDETAELYPSKVLDKRNNIIIPDNLGFIFISSNARIIAGNEDFFNRVDLVEITEEDRDLIKNINDLDKKRVTDTEKKYDLVSTIMAYTGRKN
jgi:5-methylcytosine-specific restriction protein B